MADNCEQTTEVGAAADVAMSEDSGYPQSEKSADSTQTALNMADNCEQTTEVGAAADVAMSEDSGYPQSETSADSTQTVVAQDQQQNSPASIATSGGGYCSAPTDSLSHFTRPEETSLPQQNVDPASRTEQWVEQTFEIFVKNLDGKTHTIEVEKFEKVAVFKDKVGKKLGVPMEQQRLTSQEGKTLADDNLSLHDYNIKKHSTVYCQGRLRGGHN